MGYNQPACATCAVGGGQNHLIHTSVPIARIEALYLIDAFTYQITMEYHYTARIHHVHGQCAMIASVKDQLSYVFNRIRQHLQTEGISIHR
jgi:hypothetical protein